MIWVIHWRKERDGKRCPPPNMNKQIDPSWKTISDKIKLMIILSHEGWILEVNLRLIDLKVINWQMRVMMAITGIT